MDLGLSEIVRAFSSFAAARRSANLPIMSTRRWLSGLFLLWATCGDEPISYVVVPEVPAVAPSAPAIHIVLRDNDSMMPMPGRAIILSGGNDSQAGL